MGKSIPLFSYFISNIGDSHAHTLSHSLSLLHSYLQHAFLTISLSHSHSLSVSLPLSLPFSFSLEYFLSFLFYTLTTLFYLPLSLSLSLLSSPFSSSLTHLTHSHLLSLMTCIHAMPCKQVGVWCSTQYFEKLRGMSKGVVRI